MIRGMPAVIRAVAISFLPYYSTLHYDEVSEEAVYFALMMKERWARKSEEIEGRDLVAQKAPPCLMINRL